MTHTLVVQLGYKVASRQLVYILSPCHAVTALQVNCRFIRLQKKLTYTIVNCPQVYLLASPPSPSTTITFQTHLGLLNGAVLALLFPVLDTYVMPGEVSLL